MKKEKEKKGKSSLKEKLQKRKKEIQDRSKGMGYVIMSKEGTLRVRIMQVGEDNEFGLEITQFYLGGTIKGVISPVTIGLPCAIMEKYEELKKSKKSSDKALAKKLAPKKKYMVPIIGFKDAKGKEVDEDKSEKLLLCTSGVYQTFIDHFLDEEDWGDFTDPNEGYDFKITRTGTGQFDTEYTVSPGQKSACPKKYRNTIVDLEEMLKKILPTYEETQEKLEEFLSGASDDDDDETEERPVKRDKKKKKSPKSDM